MRAIRLFVLLVGVAGFGALVGSMIGAALGKNALFAGGVLGGVLGSVGAAFLAGRLRWLDRAAVRVTATGAALGFLAAAAIAVNTLSSPIGPVLSTLLVGVGGLTGRWLAGRS